MNSNFENASQALAEDAAGHGSYLDPQTHALTVAQTEATLALAFEQRTANLIAIWSMPEPEAAGLASAAGKDKDGVEKDIWTGVARQIIERLGLA